MAITKVEYLADRLTVHYHFGQPDGWLDDGSLDISYDSLGKLPPLPKDKAGEEVSVPNSTQKIVLVPFSIREPETMSGCRSWHYEIYVK